MPLVVLSRWKMSRRGASLLSHAFVVMALCLNTACIIGSFGPKEPSVRPAQSPKHEKEFLTFYVDPPPEATFYDNQMHSIPKEMQIIKRLLEQHSPYRKVLPATVPPSNGAHVSMHKTAAKAPKCMNVSLWTLGLIPCVSVDGPNSRVHFDIYVDHVQKASYAHDITATGVM
jgi:hypothetical protein